MSSCRPVSPCRGHGAGPLCGERRHHVRADPERPAVLPAEKFTPSGDAHAAPVTEGVQAKFIGGPGRQDLKAPQMVVFLNKGREDGVAPGDLFEIRRRAERLPDGRQLINEVMATLQVVHVRDHTRHRPSHQHSLARHPAGHRRAAGRQAPVLTSGSEAVARRRGGSPAPRRVLCPVPSSAHVSILRGDGSIPSVIPGRRDHGETRRMSGRVLVTGGAGFIGSHVAEAYLRRGGRLSCSTISRAGTSRTFPRARGSSAPTSARPRRADLLATGKFDALNHHAAQIDVRVSVDQPAFDAGINVVGFVNLLEGAGEGGVKRVVFASSGGVVYGDPDVIPTPETAPKLPVCPYGVSKLAGEYYPRALGALRGFEGVAMRYANVFGPRQDPEVGGRRRLDLRLPAAGRREAHRLRRRPADARLRLREGRRPGQRPRHHRAAARRGRVRRAGLQHRHLGRSATCSSSPRSVGQVMGQKPELEFAPPRPGELFRSALDIEQGQGGAGVGARVDVRRRAAPAGRLVPRRRRTVILQAGGAVPRSAVELVLTASTETKIVLVITARLLAGLLVHHRAEVVAVPEAQPPGRPVLRRDGAHDPAAGRLPRRHEAAALALQPALPRGDHLLLRAPARARCARSGAPTAAP